MLASQAADEAHPAFSNLFVETEFVPGLETLLATRRPRSASEPQVWLAHLAAVDGEIVGSCSTRATAPRFLGRGRGIRAPLSVIDGEAAYEHRRNGSGSDREPPVAGGDSGGRDGPSRVHHAGGALPGGSARPRGEVPPAGHVRAGELAGLDACPGPAAPPPDHPGRGASLPASGQSAALRRSHVAHGPTGSGRQPQRCVRALGLRHLRRPSDRPRAHRAGRGAGCGEATGAGARVLAPEGDRRRSGDPQRERCLLCTGSPGILRSHGASQVGWP